MDEKPIEKEQEQPNVEKKVYSSPTLTVYGKVTELTGGGTKGTPEAGSPSASKRP
jgi:hypothetical protein